MDKENASWNLRDMFESDEAWEAQLAEVRGLVDRLAAQQGHAAASAKKPPSWPRS